MAARVVMLTMQGILETSMIILILFLFDWRIGLIAAAGVLIFFGVNSVMQNAGKKASEQKVVCDTELVNQIMEYLQGISEVKSYNLLGKQAKREKRKIIDDISLSIQQKTTTAIVGSSGGGKSTLCNLIARFWDVDSGEVTLGGVNVKDYSMNNCTAGNT